MLHQDEAVRVIVIATELYVAPLDRYEFPAAQPRAHCHQKQWMVVRTNLLGSLQELLDLHGGKSDAFGIGSLCRAREASQTGRWVGLDLPFLDGVVEQTANDAQCIANGVAREIFADQVIDQRLDVIAPDLIE
ncbi:MAG: hypothetical protein WA741_18930 [Candidatus Sulfotelmatobacter sp.]